MFLSNAINRQLSITDTWA